LIEVALFDLAERAHFTRIVLDRFNKFEDPPFLAHGTLLGFTCPVVFAAGSSLHAPELNVYRGAASLLKSALVE
jgi:hypothetical protein